MLKLVDRLILMELRAPLFFGIILFSGLIIAAVVLPEAANKIIRLNLPASYFLKFVALSSPLYIVLSIPMGMVLGTLLSVGRLSSDLEITALRTCGISMYRVLAPYFVTAIFMSGITLLGTERIVPHTESELINLKNDLTMGAGGKQERVTWPISERGEIRWILVAALVEGSTLSDVKLLYFDPKDEKRDFIVTSKRVEWLGSRWVFYNGRQVMLQSENNVQVAEFVKTEVPSFNITPESLALRSKTPDDLTILQLRNLIQYKLTEEKVPPNDKEILEYRTKYYFKYAIPITPLFFVCIAVPLGIVRQRTSNTTGMGIALLVVLGYYVVYMIFLKLGSAGVVPPIAAAWIPNLTLLVIGLVTMRSRERG